MELILRTINPHLHEQCLAKWEKKDIHGVLCCCMNNTAGLYFVLDNMQTLKEAGKYEEALLFAYTGTRTNWSRLGMRYINLLFKAADRQKLVEAGEPIPAFDSLQLYRGVGGSGPARRVHSYSWTGSLEKAVWFAKRAKIFGCADPAVFTITVQREHILAYSHDREEAEYLLALPLPSKPKRVMSIK